MAALANREVVQVRVVEDQHVVGAEDHLGEGLRVVAPRDVAEGEAVLDDAAEGRVQASNLVRALGGVAADEVHELDEILSGALGINRGLAVTGFACYGALLEELPDTSLIGEAVVDGHDRAVQQHEIGLGLSADRHGQSDGREQRRSQANEKLG